MSDSGSDFSSPSNVVTFTNKSSVVKLKGPNIDRQFSLNFNGNSSVQRFRDDFNQQGLKYRELSPTMSLRSVDMRPRHFKQSFCNGRFAQSSMINGREGRAVSPSASMLSIGSNVSTAATIVSAIKSGRFDYHEWKSIRDAVNKRFKSRIRKRIPRRRNLHQNMRGVRRSSGELGSDSSMSSDDCKSTRTGYNMHCHRSQFMSSYQNTFLQNGRINDDTRSANTEFAYSREAHHNHHDITKQHTFRNMNSLSNNITQNPALNVRNQSIPHNFLHIGMMRDDIRSFKTGCADLRQTIKDNTILTDCTNNLKQKVFSNRLSQGSKNDRLTNNVTENASMFKANQNNRFKSSFLLPSQGFTMSSTVLPIPEEHSNNLFKQSQTRNHTYNGLAKFHKCTGPNTGICDNTDTEDDNIFSEVTNTEKSILKQSESHKVQNFKTSHKSLNGVTEKAKLSDKAIQNHIVSVNNNKDLSLSSNGDEQNDVNDFVFAKPLLPLKNSKNNNDSATKKVSSPKPVPKDNSSYVNNENSTKENPVVSEEHSETLQSDVSLRPSFMKRKLFTQTLDMTENKSLDSSPGISPKKVYEEISKEKSKTRKLVTNQSCLSRDIPGEKNNIVDLIRKIVPPKQINATSNITHNRLDISSILSICAKDDVSDTYTDEEIFDDNKSKRKIHLYKKPCSVVIEKSNIEELKRCKSKTSIKSHLKDNGVIKNIVNPLADSFWNTDSESETPVKQRLQTVNKGISIIKKRQDAVSIKKPVTKDIKALLESTKSSNDSLLSLENIHEMSKNRSLRLRALKALKENRQTLTKQDEFQKSIYEVLNKEKKAQQKLKSSLNNTTSPTDILTREKNDVEPTEVIKEKIINKQCATKNSLRNQNDANNVKKSSVRPNGNGDELKASEAAPKNVTKANLNISKRGRPKKLNNDTISLVSTNNTAVVRKTITLRNRTLETPNVSSELDSLNISFRTRSRLKKMTTTYFEDSLNSLNRTRRRSRPKKTKCATNSTEKNKKNEIVDATKGVSKKIVPAGANTLKFKSIVTNNSDHAKQIVKTDSRKASSILQERPRVEQTKNDREVSMPLPSRQRREICINDDAKSVTARSVMSASTLTRSRRLKFLHLH